MAPSLPLDQAKIQLSALRARAQGLTRENISLRARNESLEDTMQGYETLSRQHDWLHEQYHSLGERYRHLMDHFVAVITQLSAFQSESQT